MDVTDSVAGGRQRVVGLADVVRIPIRRWRIVAAVTAGVLLLVVAYLVLLPASYRATTVVVLRPVVADPFTYPASGADRVINMTAENGIALGDEVIDVTSQTLGRSPRDVAEALKVELPTGGQVLRFEYTATEEKDAIAGANASAETYLRVRQGNYQEQREQLMLSYSKTLDQVQDQRKKIQADLPTNTGNTPSPRTQALLDQVSAFNEQIATLENQRAKIASADLTPGSISAAARSPVPSSHDAALVLIAGALLGGAVVGAMGAHAREAMDRRIRSIDQAGEVTGMAPLGVVRATSGGRSGDGAAADARYVSLGILQWIDRHPDRPVVVLSGRADEGRSTVSGNLAVALAESGRDVFLAAPAETQEELKPILFAAQTRVPPRPRAKPMTTPAKPVHPAEAETKRINGATVERSKAKGTVVASRASGKQHDPESTVVMTKPAPAPVIAPLQTEPVKIAPPSGTGPLVVLIGAGAVRLGELGDVPDRGIVVLDAPPADTDERGVRAALDGTAVLVVARDRTRNKELTRLVDRLRSAGAQTAGFVLTGGRGA